MAKQETQPEKTFGTEWKGFKFAPLTESEREILENTDSELDYSMAMDALIGAAELGYKFSIKPLYDGWYAADVMMCDEIHPAYGYMVRAENSTIVLTVYSLFLRMKRCAWDISKFPDAKKKGGRTPR